MVHNFPQLALPMYPEVSSQLRAPSKQIVTLSQRGHVQQELFEISVRKSNSQVLWKDYRTLKVEPIRKVAPEPYPGGVCGSLWCPSARTPTPENVKGGTFWWQLKVSVESEAQSRGSRQDVESRRGFLTPYREPTVRKHKAGEEVC